MTTSEFSPPLDSRWYDRFESIGSFQAYEYLDGDKQTREVQKTKFLSGEIFNPTLDYPKIEAEQLNDREKDLLAIKREILSQEPNELVKQVYRWKLNEKIAELRMLKAASDGDMRRFSKYSEFVYGNASPDVFAYTVNSIRDLAKTSTSEGTPAHEAAQQLLALFPDEVRQEKVIEPPSQEAVTIAQNTTVQEFGDLVALPESEGEFNANEIKGVFEQALINLDVSGWQVIVDASSKSGISVNQEQKTVNIPESRTLTYDKLRTLIAHEIGTHVERRSRGERSKLKLLGLGLDRYEQGEEGVATMREQALGGERVDDFAGLDGHLAIGLAQGLDGKKRDFREVFIIMAKYYEMKNLIEGKSPDLSASNAQASAWNRTVRTFRGTDCTTAGACFTKDIIYRQGNIDVWNVVKDNPAEMIRFSVGKYDPANARHLWILDTLAITDTDLSNLEE